MMDNGKKEYPENGIECDATYAKRFYCYVNHSGVTKWVKRAMNKRFRKKGKQKLKDRIIWPDSDLFKFR